MLKIDGSIGGGQVLRSALALSVFTQKPFELINIRKDRRKPGLNKQHLSCIDSLQKLCRAEVEGVKLGSTEIFFAPNPIKRHTTIIDIGSAGSITLLLQSLLLTPLTAQKRMKFTIHGGTDVAWSMTYEFFKEVIVPLLAPVLEISISCARRGFYPQGKGEVNITLEPQPFAPLQLDYHTHGKLLAIKGVSYASKTLMRKEIAEQQAMNAQFHLGPLKCPIQIREEYCTTDSEGSGITLWGIYGDTNEEISKDSKRVGADLLAMNNLNTQHVGTIVAKKLLDEINNNATVDSHSADTLIPFIGIYGGIITTSKITNHITSNIAICEQFLGITYKVDGTTISVETGYLG